MLTFQMAAVLGAGGAAGVSVAKELQRRGIPFRAVGRNAKRLGKIYGQAEGVEIAAVDALDEEATTRAFAGCEVVFHCAGVPFSEFESLPAMAQSVGRAAKAAGSRLVRASSYWSRTPLTELPAGEAHVRRPVARLAQFRKEEEDRLIEANAGVLQLPDFFGPGIARKHSLLNTAIERVGCGQRCVWFGDPTAKRTFQYAPDIGPILVGLASYPGAYKKLWIAPGSGPIEPRVALRMAAGEGGRVRLFRGKRWMLQAAGVVQRGARQFASVWDMYNEPTYFDGEPLRKALDGAIPATGYETAIPDTAAWLAHRR